MVGSLEDDKAAVSYCGCIWQRSSRELVDDPERLACRVPVLGLYPIGAHSFGYNRFEVSALGIVS